MHELKRLESLMSSWQGELGPDNIEEFAEWRRVVMEELNLLPQDVVERITTSINHRIDREKLRHQGEIIDEKIVELTENCGMDKRSAIKFMQMAADYIRRGAKLPPLLGRWLADALEAASYPERYAPSAEKDPEGTAVLMALGLKGFRSCAPRLAITGHVLSLLMDDHPRAQVMKKTAAKFGVCEKTVRRCIDDCIGRLEELNLKIDQATTKKNRGKSEQEKTRK